jgi:hypothetical protein
MIKKYNLLFMVFLCFISMPSWAHKKQDPKTSVQFHADAKLLIHQPNKPHNEGFKTKEDAEKVTTLIITKIKNGEMPTNITTEELKKLNVL